MTLTEYCGQLKVLTDTLRDVGAPVSDPDLVVSLLSGLNDKFGNCVTTIFAARPRMPFFPARISPVTTAPFAMTTEPLT